jgi:hypothetical protein
VRGVWIGWLLAGCGAPSSFPNYLDSPPADASPGGVSSESLNVIIFLRTQTASGVTPETAEILVGVFDLGFEPVPSAAVVIDVDGTVLYVPEVDTGIHALELDHWPTLTQVDIRRDPDFVDDVLLYGLPVHTTGVDAASLGLGSPLALTWDPNGDRELTVDVFTVLGQDTAFSQTGLDDSGIYQGSEPAFPVPGSYQIVVDRYRELRVQSQSSAAFVDMFVVENVDIAAPPDGGPPDGPADAAPDGP